MSEFLVLGEMNDWANVGASLKYPALAEILWPPAKKYEISRLFAAKDTKTVR